MALLPPRVKAPLSVCSDRVRIEGQLTGAFVEVFAGATLVASGVAGSAAHTFMLTSPLAAGADVRAQQTIGSDVSVLSPDPVIVQEKPPAIGPVSFKTPLYVCGECVWVEGAVPGAKVEVLGNGGPRGSTTTYDGNARMGLNAPIASGETLRAQQTACGEKGPDLPGPSPLLPAGRAQGQVLPKPVVQTGLRACQKGVVVSNVLPGARVTLYRSGGPNLNACFDETSLRFTVNPPLAEGETLQAKQEFLNCEAFSDLSDPEIVGPAEPVPPPVVHAPICTGATSIRLSGIHYGSIIKIFYGGTALGMAEAPEEGTFDFPIPPLPAPSHHGGDVYAQQELCGIWSSDSNRVMVDPMPAHLTKPEISEPLVACAAAVHVKHTFPGARVYVFSAFLNAPIGEEQVYHTEATIPVAPLLMAGDTITAYQIGCSQQSDTSDPVEVKSLEQLDPPAIETPLYSCQNVVVVLGAIPGARVDVFVNEFIRGTALAGGSRTEVSISGGIQVGDLVSARQRMCDRTTEPGRPVRVERFDGRWFTVGNSGAAEILAVHAALLRTGKIVYFGGDQHDGALNRNNDVDHTRLFDCATYIITPVTGLPGNVDLFCSGHAQLPDGRILAAGGTQQWPGDVSPDPHGHGAVSHFTGGRHAWIFDPADELWHQADPMMTQRPDDPTRDTSLDIEATGGKWYPTLVTLPSGKVIAVSGHPRELDTRHNNNTLEQYNPSSGKWEYIGPTDCNLIPRGVGRSLEYPRMFVLPDNRLLSVSQLNDGSLSAWNIGTDANVWDTITTPKPGYGGNPLSETAVLLPLKPSTSYRARVLLCGESDTWVLDPAGGSSLWTATARNLIGHPAAGDMNPRRANLDAVLLPTGEVFVCGGAKDERSDATGVKKAEMFDPEDTTGSSAGSWRVLPEAQEVRNYHSVALLMPNGAVWVAGSNINSSSGLGNRNLWIEIFEPWYFCHNRPRVVDAPLAVCVGNRFDLVTPQAADIERVVLVRCGTCTHNFNPDQRVIELDFEYDPADRLTVQAPPNTRIAPPGYYLLFVLDGDRVPSEGRFIRICPSNRIVHPPRDWWEIIIRYLAERFAPIDVQDIQRYIPVVKESSRHETVDPLKVIPISELDAILGEFADHLEGVNGSVHALREDVRYILEQLKTKTERKEK